MTPKEKAQELVQRFRGLSAPGVRSDSTLWSAKQCALIAVDEIINVAWWSGNGVDLLPEPYVQSQKEYWQSVKNEIQIL